MLDSLAVNRWATIWWLLLWALRMSICIHMNGLEKVLRENCNRNRGIRYLAQWMNSLRLEMTCYSFGQTRYVMVSVVVKLTSLVNSGESMLKEQLIQLTAMLL